MTLAARRARQINSYFNQLGDGLGAIVPPQVTSVARKPLSIALRGDRRRQDHLVRPTRDDGDEASRRGAERGRGQPPPTRSSRATRAVLAGRRIVLGVTGGIAAYKAVEVCRRLVDAGAHVVAGA